MKSIFEEMGGTYSNINGYLLPYLAIPESPPLGKWGRVRMRYLKEHHPALYSSMLLTGRLDQHLAEIDRSYEEQLEHIIQQMTKQEGVTEELKAADQMEWIRRMKSIRSRTEAFVRHELVYYYKLCLKNARISSYTAWLQKSHSCPAPSIQTAETDTPQSASF